MNLKSKALNLPARCCHKGLGLLSRDSDELAQMANQMLEGEHLGPSDAIGTVFCQIMRMAHMTSYRY